MTGHGVTALVRDPAVMKGLEGISLVQGKPVHPIPQPKPQSKTHKVVGSPTQLSDVRQAFRDRIPDVVIVTLNAPRASDSPFAAPISPPRLMADSNANVVTAMKEFGIKKIVIMQAFGVGASWPNMSCLLRGLMRVSNMSYQYGDHNMADKEVRESGVTYVMVRPSRLVETDVTTVREWLNDGKGVPLMASTSRKSVACFLVDATVEDRWDNTAPVITN